MTALPTSGNAAAVTPPLRLAELALDAITEMVSVVGEDQVYRLVNRAWCRTMRVPAQAAVGCRAGDLFPGRVDGERMRGIRRCLDAGVPITIRGPMALPHLAGRTYEAIYTPYGRDDAGVPCVVIVTRDVTGEERQREALAASHLHLERTLDTTGDGIYAHDADDLDGPVRFANARLLEMWGLPAAMQATLTPRQLFVQAATLYADPAAEDARLQRLLRDGTPGADAPLDRVVLRDGRTLLRRCALAVHGQGLLRVWSFRDITTEARAQRQLDDARAQTQRLLAAFPGLIAELDHRLVYTYANDAFLRVAGRPRESVVGHAVDEVLGPERADEVRMLAAQALEHGSVVFERWQGPHCIRVTMSGRRDAATGLPCYEGFGFDITDLRRAEQALIAARDEAEHANRAKSQFLSHMSHELRTPLNAVLGFAQLMTDDGALPGVQLERSREILRGARHLHRLINDMLDLARIEAGRLPIELGPVPLLPLVQECLSLVEPLARERDVQLQPVPVADFDATVRTDALRLRQVLLNLLGNAIKYNRYGGRVSLAAGRRGELLHLEVIDDGLGLEPAQIERLFQPFERLHDEVSVEGTGIGLALSQRLVVGMGGRIGVESEPGRGCRFWVELPLHATGAAATPPERTPATGPQAASGPPRTVLYIEDNPVNITLMEAMLTRVPGVVLHCEELPLPGLDRAVALVPDLILLDIQLPGLSGFEVLERLQADPRTRHIPVVAVSANAMPDDVAAGHAAGFYDYLSKPLELSGLIATVQRALARAATLAPGPRP
ncbi:MAG: PAS domain-containing protein [Rubrivivax sp.]|nr:PAS domain-containing protein [Rubrivivax sp.]